MVTDKKKDSHKNPGKQGSDESNKINASTAYDFNGENRLLRPDIEADSSRHGPVPVRAEHHSRHLHRLCTAESTALYGPRPDPDSILKIDKLPLPSTFWRFVK